MEEYFNNIRKFNWWNKQYIDIGFQRDYFLNAIRPFLGNKLVKVLVGQRRVGKSYIMRQLIDVLIKSGVNNKNILYINKEFIEYNFLETATDLAHFFNLYQQKLKPKGKIYLLIDEIQNIVDWEHFINSKSQDFSTEHEIFITGSNSKLLSGELATLLSGRYISFEILPFSYSEFCAVNQLDQNSSTYIQYMQTSGLPELINLSTEETKRHYLASLMDTVLLRDIIQRHTIQNTALLRDIFIYIVNNASNLLSINNMVKYFKGKNRRTTYDTLANYLGYIQDTFLIHRVERYDLKGKEIIGGTYKYYVNDLGFKNYLFSGFGYGLGYLLENLVYLTLRRLGFSVYVGENAGKEVDFYAIKNDKTIYLQVAYTLSDDNTKEREYRVLKSISDNYPKFVVSMDEFHLPNHEGIIHVKAWELEAVFLELKK